MQGLFAFGAYQILKNRRFLEGGCRSSLAIGTAPTSRRQSGQSIVQERFRRFAVGLSGKVPNA
jgi:hypothetical protein